MYIDIYTHTHTYPLPLEPPFHAPIPSLSVITEHQVEPPVLCSNFPVAIYTAYGSVYICVTVSI